MRSRKPRKTHRITGKEPDSQDWAFRFARFLDRSELSPLTVENYLGDVLAFTWWFQTRHRDHETFHPRLITPTDLRDFKRCLIDEWKQKPATVNRKLAALTSFLKWAAQKGLTVHGKIPPIPKRLALSRRGPRWLDRREQHALIRAMERGGKRRDLALVQLLLNTGLRVRELCSLTWEDVALSERKGTLVVRQGKGGKRREIPLNKDARTALEALGYAELAKTAGSVFRGQRGPLTSRGVQLMLAKYLKVAGLEKGSPHVLRHAFCKNLVDAGVGLEQVATLAGHESLETTRRYCEPSFADLQRAVERIGETED